MGSTFEPAFSLSHSTLLLALLASDLLLPLPTAALVLTLESIKLAVSRRLEPPTLTGRRTRFRLRDTIRCLSLLPAAVACFHIVIALLGAPALADTTLALAVLLASLAAAPSILMRLVGQPWSTPPASIGAVLGAWLGAFTLPLDWDRSWQQFPLPCCVGALIGFALVQAGLLAQALASRRTK